MINVNIIGKPSPAQRAAFKRAKEALGITDSMLFVEARPGCGRAISFGPPPEFAIDWMTLHGQADQDVEDILGWYCNLRNEWRVATVGTWLEKAFGRSGVRELDRERISVQ